MQLDVGKLGGAVDRHEHVELSLFGPHLCDVDVEEGRIGTRCNNRNIERS